MNNLTRPVRCLKTSFIGLRIRSISHLARPYPTGVRKDVDTIQSFNTTSRANLSATFRMTTGIQSNFMSKRFKVSKSGKRKTSDIDDEESDDEGDEGENPLLMEEEGEDNGSIRDIDVNSLRLDSIAKSSFSMTRAKVDELLYKGDILLNGEIASKKSANLTIGDEIDLVQGPDADDPTLIRIKRVQIVSLPDKAHNGRLKVGISSEALTVKGKDR